MAASRLGRGAAIVAAIWLGLQPITLNLAQAQVISDPTAPIAFRPAVSSAPNGVPVVDITAPSFGGLSHNRFESYNVDTNGLILNNSGLSGDSILGGAIPANPNLVGRQPARTILNEVTGTGASTLAGPTEVFGRRADVIVANPNGIGCVGCSFINAGRVTLSTGVPIPDYRAGTVAFDVRHGAIDIAGRGVSAVPGQRAIDQIDLIGRQIAIEAPVVAQDRIRLRAGAMHYDPGRDLADDIAGAPALAGDAIVSTPDGVIAAGAISILSRDVDLGVALDGRLTSTREAIVIASMGDLQTEAATSAADLRLDAEGNLALGGTFDVAGRLRGDAQTITIRDGNLAAADAVVLEARGDLDADAQILAGSAISLVAEAALTARGRLLAGGRVALEGDRLLAEAIEIGGETADIVAEHDLIIRDAALAALRGLSITGEDVTLGEGTGYAAGDRFLVTARRDFTNATILDHDNLSLSIGGSFINAASGAFLRDAHALIVPGDIVNHGLIQSRAGASMLARSLINTADGVLDAPGLSLSLSEAFDNSGTVFVDGDLTVAAGSMTSSADGVIYAAGSAGFTLSGDAANAGLLIGDAGLTISGRDLVNAVDAVLYGPGLTLTASRNLGIDGTLLADGGMRLTASGHASGAGSLRAGSVITLDLGSLAFGADGEMLAPNIDLTVAGDGGSAGEIAATELFIGEIGGAFDQGGALRAVAEEGALAPADFGLSVGGALTNSGEIRSDGAFHIAAGALTSTSAGRIIAPQVNLAVTGTLANHGLIRSDRLLAIEAGALINSGANSGAQAWMSGEDLLLRIGGAISLGSHAVLEARRQTNIAARSSNLDLTNSNSIAQGRFSFGEQLALEMTGQALHLADGARIMAYGDLSLNFHQGISVHGGIAAGGDLVLAAPGGSISVGASGTTHPQNAWLFTLGDAHFTAGGNMLVYSSAVEVLGSATVDLGGTLLLNRARGPTYSYSHEQYIQGSQLWLHRYYREYERADPAIFNVAGDLAINSGAVSVTASTLAAGGDLSITTGTLSNNARQLRQYYDYWKLTGAKTGYRGRVHQGTWSATPSLIRAGGNLALNASGATSNSGSIIGNQVSVIAPSISVGVTDANVYTAPPSVPDPVIDLARYAISLPGSAARPVPTAISPDGPRYLITAPLAGRPRYDAEGLPVSEREPSWILRQVGDARGNDGSAITFLADPLTERMLIQRALVEQTGRTMLAPEFDSAEAQQEALYQGTVDFLLANPEIRLGDQLTAAQRAAAEVPMLWYSTRMVDGVRVLAPELILPQDQLRAYAYRPGGSIEARESLMIQGDRVYNAGSLVARAGLSIVADEFINERRVAGYTMYGTQRRYAAQAGGNVIAGDLTILTEGDLINRGGTFWGDDAVTLMAGDDIRFEAQRVANDIITAVNRRNITRTRSVIHTAASAGSGGDMTIVADGGFTLRGSELTARGDIAVQARDGITIASVVDDVETVHMRSSRGLLRSSRTTTGSRQITNRASLIGAGGDVTLATGGDIAVHASELAAGERLRLAAGVGEGARTDAGIAITAGRDVATSFFEHRSSGFGLFTGGGRLDFYRSTRTREDNLRGDNAPSSLIAGGDILVTAPGDIALQGSVVGAGGVAEILAGRDLALTPGGEAQARRFEQRTSGFGFGFSSGGGGASVSLGLARERLLDERRRDSDVGSLIGGGEGVLLEAGRDLAVIAAEITSPADIALIAGRDLDILPGAIVERHRRVESQSFAGITASVGTNVVGAAQRLGDAVDVFGSGHGDARYEALGMVSGVLQGVDAVRDLSNPGVSASLSIGYSASRFEQQSRFDGVAPARIDAGGDLALAAGRDLAVAALQARAGGDLDLYAGRDLAIESALATQSQSLRHSATSAALGLDLGWSVAGGQSLGLSLSANHARGNQSGTAASQVDSDLRAGERLALLTGNDALIAGAQLRGRDILLDIGGDLHVASRADTARLRGSSLNAGFGLTIGLMPGAGSSLDLSLGGGRERADSTLINQQTAIIADERLEAYVEGHTQLDGGLIASLNGDLSLDTGTLGFSDITERARSDSRRATVSLGLGGNAPSIGVEGELAHEATDAITRATIGEGAITIRDEDAQRAREEAGETENIAALNRDLDAARETLRDERAGVRFYASDSSVRELASGFAQTRQNIAAAAEILSQALEALSPEDRARAEEIAENLDPEADAADHAEKIADDIKEENELADEDRDAITALVAEVLLEAASDPEVAAQLNACIAPGRRGFNLHDLIFSRAHAEAAAICPQQLAEIGARYGANVLRGAALGATSAAAFLTALLYPSGSFGDMTVERIEGVDGSVIEIRNQPGESSAVMTATDAGGNEFAFDMVRTSDGYVVVGGYQKDGLGGLVPISPRQAIDIAGTLFGQGNEGFTEHRNDGMTVITPAADQLPLIFVTPPVQQEGVTLATPANPQRPLDLITTAPDLGWVTAWENRRLSSNEVRQLLETSSQPDPSDRGGQLTKAGRALQKHGGRQGSVFPEISGGPAQINIEGKKIVREILNNPNSSIKERLTGRFGPVLEVRAPDNRGLRFSTNGEFIGFLEP
ncbi:hemagglutinin repeat-containing protein [Saliniramus fredricksonii]|uniref:hemagglutinin repeat-containing protein n=1 Tax=Saliniramus fredricksonii TaxID=1653334 RepID=UPI0013F4E56A|nr:hemagglutinin repeat-containing protein [Saliniramus fredricksonii]